MKNKKILIWIGWIIGILVCAQFGYSAAAKLVPSIYPDLPAGMEKMGLPMDILPLIASLEIMCIVFYLIPQTAVLGAVLFTGYLGGAMLTHLRVHEPVFLHIILGGLIWLGIYLREPRLHVLLPLRRK